MKIYLIGQSHFDFEEFLRFVESNDTTWRRTVNATHAEELVEVAGRICYMSFGKNQSPKTNEQYIQHLIDSAHESVLEHVSWTFLIEGVSRALSHQLVRHRVGFAVSQLSQQYHDETEAEFIEPKRLGESSVAKDAWTKLVNDARATYETILREVDAELPDNFDSKRREMNRAMRSIARSVLPNATATKLVVTVNGRSLRHLLTCRGTIEGDIEMRLLSSSLLELVKPTAPSIFFDFQSIQHNDGFPIIERGDRKK